MGTVTKGQDVGVVSVGAHEMGAVLVTVYAVPDTLDLCTGMYFIIESRAPVFAFHFTPLVIIMVVITFLKCFFGSHLPGEAINALYME